MLPELRSLSLDLDFWLGLGAEAVAGIQIAIHGEKLVHRGEGRQGLVRLRKHRHNLIHRHRHNLIHRREHWQMMTGLLGNKSGARLLARDVP